MLEVLVVIIPVGAQIGRQKEPGFDQRAFCERRLVGNDNEISSKIRL